MLSDDEVYSQAAWVPSHILKWNMIPRFRRTFVFAGHETSASTLSWLLYELSKHPEQQERIRQEIAEVRSRYPERGELTSQDYDSMKYANAVIKARYPTISIA